MEELQARVKRLLAPSVAACEGAATVQDADERSQVLGRALDGVRAALLEIARAIDPGEPQA